MKEQIRHLVYEIELEDGERLTLPESLIESVGAGRWLITIAPADGHDGAVRMHGAFLNGYSPQDEGLYDDCAAR